MSFTCTKPVGCVAQMTDYVNLAQMKWQMTKQINMSLQNLIQILCK
jgi:hypothetical protein